MVCRISAAFVPHVFAASARKRLKSVTGRHVESAVLWPCADPARPYANSTANPSTGSALAITPGPSKTSSQTGTRHLHTKGCKHQIPFVCKPLVARIGSQLCPVSPSAQVAFGFSCLPLSPLVWPAWCCGSRGVFAERGLKQCSCKCKPDRNMTRNLWLPFQLRPGKHASQFQGVFF